uniref:Uncharacterized protein n=1 Tax=Tanacetum cinerariifolium TaxID=118510 RepID=A0A699GLF3_TANCI|nr:hypothetical protein [Tanacetum cinerariifolium]
MRVLRQVRGRARLDIHRAHVTPVVAQGERTDIPGRALVELALVDGRVGHVAACYRVVAEAIAVARNRRGLELEVLHLVEAEAEVEGAPFRIQRQLLRLQLVSDVDVETAGLLQARVGALGCHTARTHAVEGAVGSVTTDLRAGIGEGERRVLGHVVARVEHVGGAGARDRIGDRDLVVVERDGQARHRFPYQAQGLGLGHFRTQLGIAAGQGVDLARRWRRQAADIADRHAGQAAQVGQRAGRIGLRHVDARQLARVDRQIGQAGDLGCEQFVDVRCARGFLHHSAEAQRLHRRPFATHFPAAVADGVGLARLEVGAAVAQVGIQGAHERLILDQRDLRFDRQFAQAERTGAVRRGRARAQHFALDLRGGVGLGAGRYLAGLAGDGHGDRLVGERADHLVAQVALEGHQAHVLLHGLQQDGAGVHKAQHFRGDRAGRAKHVERYAIVGGVDALGGGQRVERLPHLGQRAPVAAHLGLVGGAARPRRIIGPVEEGVALDADRVLQGAVAEVVQARAQFDKAAVDGHRHQRGIAGHAVGGQDAAAFANLLARRFGDVRVADRDIEDVAERPRFRQRGRDLAAGVEHFAVHLGMVVDAVIRQRRRLRAVQAGRIVIQRIGVVRHQRLHQAAAGRIDLPVAAQAGRAAGADAHGKAGRHRGAGAAGQAGGRAEAGLAVGTRALAQRIGRGLANAQHDVAASFVEAGAHGDVGAAALGVVVVGGAAVRRGGVEAGEVTLEVKVDDAGHGVGAVGHRRAAGQQVHPAQQGDGNRVGVHRAVQAERHQAAAVDQHQRAVGAQAAQVHSGGAAGAVVGTRTDRRHGHRQSLDELFHRYRLGRFDVFRRNR